MPQSEHLRYPRGFDRSTSLHIYAEQSGPKTLVSEDAIDRSPEHHTDGAADLCVECLPFQSVQKLDIAVASTQYMSMQAKPETKLDTSTWFMCRFLYEWTSYKFYGEDSF